MLHESLLFLVKAPLANFRVDSIPDLTPSVDENDLAQSQVFYFLYSFFRSLSTPCIATLLIVPSLSREAPRP